MHSLSELELELDYTSREQWEKFLKAELKLDVITTKTSKNSPDGSVPILSLEAVKTVQLPVTSAWKKAAQTYVSMPTELGKVVEEDLQGGVRAFFLEKDSITQEELDHFLSVLDKFETPSELEVFLLGDRDVKRGTHSFKVIDEQHMLSGRGAYAPGGNNVQELALMCRNLIDQLESSESHLYIGVYVGTHFFRNIAKIRAAKLLTKKILESAKSSKTFSIVALTSYREWTLFERYSNILRNDVSVASAYIAGADHVQSSGYQTLFELEAQVGTSPEHSERSRRMARNTSHILALESLLGVVGDAAFGSYHLENLTQDLCAKSWKLMQKLVTLSAVECQDFMTSESSSIRDERKKMINTRRVVMAGINDYPDAKDTLGSLILKPRFYRLAEEFETLRLRVAGMKKPPKVYIALYGDYGALNARLNFVKNYFELLGLEVSDAGHSVTEKKEFSSSLKGHENDLVVICSLDDLYPEIFPLLGDLKAREKFIAGKTEHAGFENLFAGQNIFDVLSRITANWSVA